MIKSVKALLRSKNTEHVNLLLKLDSSLSQMVDLSQMVYHTQIQNV